MKDTSPAALFTYPSDCGVSINPKLYDKFELRVPKGGIRHPSMCWENKQILLDIVQGALIIAFFKDNLSRVVRDRVDLYDEAIAEQQSQPLTPKLLPPASEQGDSSKTAEAATIHPMLLGDEYEYKFVEEHKEQYTFNEQEQEDILNHEHRINLLEVELSELAKLRSFVFNAQNIDGFISHFMCNALGWSDVIVGDCYRIRPPRGRNWPLSLMYEFNSENWPKSKGSIVGPLVTRAEVGPMKIDVSWLTQHPTDERDVRSSLSIRYRSTIAPHIDAYAILAIMIHGKAYPMADHMFNIGEKFTFFNSNPGQRSSFAIDNLLV